MAFLISNLLSESSLDFRKWSNGKSANTRICRFSVTVTVQKHFVYILQLAVQTVQMNWICRLGRYLMVPGRYGHSHRFKGFFLKASLRSITNAGI